MDNLRDMSILARCTKTVTYWITRFFHTQAGMIHPPLHRPPSPPIHSVSFYFILFSRSHPSLSKCKCFTHRSIDINGSASWDFYPSVDF